MSDKTFGSWAKKHRVLLAGIIGLLIIGIMLGRALPFMLNMGDGGETGNWTQIKTTTDSGTGVTHVLSISAPISTLTYTEGTTGHNEVFSTTHTDARNGYTVSVDGKLVTSAIWREDPISVNLDGLAVGAHNCSVTVSDSIGQHATATMDIVVEAIPPVPPPPEAPTISVTNSPLKFQNGTTGYALVFHTTSSSRATYTVSVDGGNATSYSWATDDIAVVADTLSIGSHSVLVTVTDGLGKQASATGAVIVSETPPDLTPLQSDYTMPIIAATVIVIGLAIIIILRRKE